MIFLDLDDFCEDNSKLDALYALKKEIPQLKVNLFTIPARCSCTFIEDMKSLDWVDMIPHGFLHTSSIECAGWDYLKSKTYLLFIERLNLTKGFKAPGWQISDGMYKALLEKNYFVADQAYNDFRRPKKLRTYILDSPNKIHGHIGHMGGYNQNELQLITPYILKFSQEEFGFIKDVV